MFVYIPFLYLFIDSFKIITLKIAIFCSINDSFIFPFFINRFSSQITIQQFIDERLEFMVDYYYLDDSIIQETKNGAGPVILLTCNKCDIL